ncbi:hypothetical protein [Flammeovirga sp. OC4]|uniref:hypothetical protein n=1 Tax=Flammeovirga sp. OC4 TaxID=1382345 RepID=UPI000693B24E|nr:hypothetical protein [Flammeovirga sp. OC4]
MSSRYPNPWNFSNTDKNLISKDGKYRIEYGEMYEIAMGAPLCAECFLLDSKSNKKIKVCDWAGGSAVWDESIMRVVLPIWTKNRSQQIRVIDIDNNKILTFSKVFRVLEIVGIEGDIVYGVDSPINKTRKLEFDLRKEKISSEIELISGYNNGSNVMTGDSVNETINQKKNFWARLKNWWS